MLDGTIVLEHEGVAPGAGTVTCVGSKPRSKPRMTIGSTVPCARAACSRSRGVAAGAFATPGRAAVPGAARSAGSGDVSRWRPVHRPAGVDPYADASVRHGCALRERPHRWPRPIYSDATYSLFRDRSTCHSARSARTAWSPHTVTCDSS